MSNQFKPKAQPKKSFSWGISSASISFMQSNELQAARDGSSSDCGSGVSPVQQPKRKPKSTAASKG